MFGMRDWSEEESRKMGFFGLDLRTRSARSEAARASGPETVEAAGISHCNGIWRLRARPKVYESLLSTPEVCNKHVLSIRDYGLNTVKAAGISQCNGIWRLRARPKVCTGHVHIYIRDSGPETIEAAGISHCNSKKL